MRNIISTDQIVSSRSVLFGRREWHFLTVTKATLMPQSHWGWRYYGLSRSLLGHPSSWTGMYRVKMTFFCRKISPVDRRGPQDPGAPRGTPVHPGRAPAGPRFIPALSRFTPVLGPVLHGSPRSMPAEPRWRYGSSRFSMAELRSFPVHHGSSRRGENAV